MEVLKDSKNTLISNTEVLLLLNQQSSRGIGFREVSGKAASYLEKNGVGLERMGVIGGAVKEMKELGMSEQEVVQILNLLPKTIVHFHLIIQSCSDRFGDKDLETIMGIVARLRVDGEGR